MADGPSGRNRRTKRNAGQDSSGSGSLYSGLPIFAPDAQGSERGAAVRGYRVNETILASLRDDAGRSSERIEWEDYEPALLRVGGGLPAGEQRDRGHDNRSETDGIQMAEETILAQLAHVQDGYREPVEETAGTVAVLEVRDRDEVVTENTNAFDNLVVKAIGKGEEILNIPLPPMSDENFGKILSAQQALTTALINSGLKADENRFRRRQSNALEKIFEAMRGDNTLKVINQPVLLA